MTQIKKTITGLVFMAGCLILVTGCGREDNIMPSVAVRSNRAIGVNVTTTGATRSTEVTTNDLKLSEGFVLDVYANDTWYDLDYTSTTDPAKFGFKTGDPHLKGLYIDSEGAVNVKYSGSQIEYTPDVTLRTASKTKTDGWYIFDPSKSVASGFYYEPYNWITGGTDGDKDFYLRFWARYPKDADVDEAAEGKRTITVAPDPDGTTETFTYALPTSVAGSDATNQKDILFAYSAVHKEHTAPTGDPLYYPVFPEISPDATDDNVNLTFNHPLSMINFCVSPDDGTYDVHLKIKRITIANVPSGGSCVFNGEGSISALTMFQWTPTGNASYSQDYNAMFDVPPTGWTASSYGSAGKHIYTCQNAFMLIPHTPKYVSGGSDNAKITIVFEDTFLHDGDVERTIELNPGGTDVWKPGYYYTYKICATKIGRDVTTSVYLTDWTNPSSTTNIY